MLRLSAIRPAAILFYFLFFFLRNVLAIQFVTFLREWRRLSASSFFPLLLQRVKRIKLCLLLCFITMKNTGEGRKRIYRIFLFFVGREQRERERIA